MNKAILLGSIGVLVAGSALAGGFYTAKPAVSDAAKAQLVAGAETATNRKEIEEIVRDYLLKNPEILMEVQTALEEKQKEAQRVASLETIKSSKDAIYNAATDGVVGNPNGKTTIVEFYDYNCGFCKRAITDMQLLTTTDPDLRFVLKELPILGPDFAKGARRGAGVQASDAGEICGVSHPPAWRLDARDRGDRDFGRHDAGRRRDEAA